MRSIKVKPYFITEFDEEVICECIQPISQF